MGVDTPEPRISTQRLLLRPPSRADAVYIAELANDAEVARMTTGVRHPYRLADAERYLDALADRGPSKSRVFLVEHSSFGPLGLAGLYHRDAWVPELGYWMGRTFRNQGFATEALRALLSWAAQDWDMRAALAGCFIDNPASARVLEKAGFLYTGEMRQRFSLGRSQAVATRMMVWLA